MICCGHIVFSPAGWDSVKKINILSEHLKVILPDDAFDDHIVKPQMRKVKKNAQFVVYSICIGTFKCLCAGNGVVNRVMYGAV